MPQSDRPDLDRLRRIAEAMTPGTRGAVELPLVLPDGKPLGNPNEKGFMVSTPGSRECLRRIRDQDVPFTSFRIAIMEASHYLTMEAARGNAEAMAAFDRETCLALLDLIATLRAEVEAEKANHTEVTAVYHENERLRAEVSRLRGAVAELCLLQYGTEPANLDAIVAKYAKMRQDRIEMDAALVSPEEPAHE